MEATPDAIFKINYQRHIQHLKLKGLQPNTIDAYSRAIRRIGERFDGRIDALSEQQLTDYFTELLATRSWSAVKLDIYWLKFYYGEVSGEHARPTFLFSDRLYSCCSSWPKSWRCDAPPVLF